MLAEVVDLRVGDQIAACIESLRTDPEKLGKPLLGELSGYRSLRSPGQRFRIIYRIENKQVVVLVAVLGTRKEGDRRDIHALARKLVRLGLLNCAASGHQE